MVENFSDSVRICYEIQFEESRLKIDRKNFVLFLVTSKFQFYQFIIDLILQRFWSQVFT